MKQLMRRLTRVADTSSSPEYHPLKESRRRRRREEAAEGHVPVYVGDEMERFEVRAELLGRPVFAELLRRAAAEYGYGQRGPLRIPCSVVLFRRVLGSLIGSGEDEEELVRAVAGEELT